MTAPNNDRNKWALLIGINKYAKLAARYQLYGCVNDVELMATILRDSFGFPEGNITLLKDEQATRDNILSNMDELVDRVSDNDIVVIHYSGHGSQMTDREGDEPDGLDETIVPHDSGRSPHPNRDITDDEIYVRMLRLTETTPYVTLIFDCCHSGTISRDPFGANSRWMEPDERPTEELPPSSVVTEVASEASRDLGLSGWLPLGKRYVLIAACRDEESSFEHSVRQDGDIVMHGALTYFLSQELVKAEPGATYRDVFERASTQVTAAHSRQHPQMEGARDRELLGVRDIEPMRFVPVRGRAGDEVTLGAGAAHGMTVGSQWAIYPQLIKRVTEETPKLGLVKITEVRAVTSDAQILEETEVGAIAQGTRAVEEAHFYGQMLLVVDIQGPAGYEEAVAELAELIAESELLRQAEDGETADARAYLIAPRTEVGDDDPVPQLGAVAEATWAVVGQDGRLMLPTRPVDQAGVPTVLRDNLEMAVRYRQALALRNPNDDSLLERKVEFILKRQAPDGTWEIAEPEDNGGQIVFEEGELIAAEIVNHHDAPIYVSVFDFGLTGAIGLLHPVAGASEQLAPGNSIHIGVRQGDELELYLPDNFPYVPDPTDEEAVGGTETFKLFATTHEADFSLLAHEGYRDIGLRTAKGADSALGQLLDMALTGYGLRDARPNRVLPDEEWTTVERSFFLQETPDVRPPRTPFVPETPSEQPRGKRYALVIGIDDYNPDWYRRLRHAVKDARAISDKLRDDFGFEVTLLANGDANIGAIRDILECWAAETKPEDNVLVFFAGHGTNHPAADRQNEGYLLPVDGSRDDPDSWLPESEIIKRAKNMPARWVFLIFDACYAGTTFRHDIPTGARDDQVLKALVAGTEDQPVLDGGAGDHSIFTRAILDGLDGLADSGQVPDDIISAGELIVYVESEVPWRSRLRGHEQTPKGGPLQGSKTAQDFEFRPVKARLSARLLRNICSPRAEERVAAAQQLGERVPSDSDEVVQKKAHELIKLVCNDKVLDVRKTAAKALGELGHPTGLEILSASLRAEEEGELRAAAASALGDLAKTATCRQDAVQALINVLSVSDAAILEAAKLGLGKVPESAPQLSEALEITRQPRKQVLDALACLVEAHPGNEKAWPALTAIDCRLLRRFYLARRRLRPQLVDIVRKTVRVGLLGAVGLSLAYLVVTTRAHLRDIKLFGPAVLSVTALPGALAGASLAAVPLLACSVTRRPGGATVVIGSIISGLLLSLCLAIPEWFLNIGCFETYCPPYAWLRWLLPGLIVGPMLGLTLVCLPEKLGPSIRQAADKPLQLTGILRGNVTSIVIAALVGAFGFAVVRIPTVLSFGWIEPHWVEVLLWGSGGAVFGAALAIGWHLSPSVGRQPALALRNLALFPSRRENVQGTKGATD